MQNIGNNCRFITQSIAAILGWDIFWGLDGYTLGEFVKYRNNNLMMRRAGLSRWKGGIYFGCSVDDGRDLNLEIGNREISLKILKDN